MIPLCPHVPYQISYYTCRHAKCLNNLFPLNGNFTEDEMELLSPSQTKNFCLFSVFIIPQWNCSNEWKEFFLPNNNEWNCEWNAEMPKGRLTVDGEQKCYNEKSFSALIWTGFVIMCIKNEWLTIYFRRKCIPIFILPVCSALRSSNSFCFQIASFLKIIFLAFNNVCMQCIVYTNVRTSCIVYRFVFYFSKCDQSTSKKNRWSISHCISVLGAFI